MHPFKHFALKHATTYRFLFPHNKYVCVYNVIVINSLLIESIVRSIIGDHPSHDKTIISRDIRGALTSPKTVSVYCSTCTVSERYIFSLLTIANDVAIRVYTRKSSSSYIHWAICIVIKLAIISHCKSVIIYCMTL